MARAKAEPGSVEKLTSDLRQVVVDVEELLRATAGQAGEKIGEARVKAERTLSYARSRLSDLEEQALDKAREAAGDADEYVRENPWQAIGITAGVAFLIGLLVSRR
jgi:ElaB/YqjD/DUF883 family membrane-anchored ribosome-binding protein